MKEKSDPIIIEGKSVLIYPKMMEIDKLYPIIMDRTKLYYRKPKEGIIEVLEEITVIGIDIGTEIKIEKAYDEFPIDKVGCKGHVIRITKDRETKELLYGIEFDFSHKRFHNCCGHGKEGYSYYFPSDHISKVEKK